MIDLNSAFKKGCIALLTRCSGNQVMIPGGEKLTIFEEPLIGFASAEDELFSRYKAPEAIGPIFWGPKEWLPEARTVVSFFFPFTETVRKSNLQSSSEPSIQWLYGRIEGQQYINEYMDKVKQWLLHTIIEKAASSGILARDREDAAFSLT